MSLQKVKEMLELEMIEAMTPEQINTALNTLKDDNTAMEQALKAIAGCLGVESPEFHPKSLALNCARAIDDLREAAKIPYPLRRGQVVSVMADEPNAFDDFFTDLLKPLFKRIFKRTPKPVPKIEPVAEVCWTTAGMAMAFLPDVEVKIGEKLYRESDLPKAIEKAKICTKFAVYYDNLGVMPYTNGYLSDWDGIRLFSDGDEANKLVDEHYSRVEVACYAVTP